MVEKPKGSRLHDLIIETTSPSQFREIIEQLVTEDSKRILGENASRRITAAILSTSVIAPAPATFSERRFRLFVGIDENKNPLPNEQIDELTQLCLNLGVFELVPTEEADARRFIITDLELHETIKSIHHNVLPQQNPPAGQ